MINVGKADSSSLMNFVISHMFMVVIVDINLITPTQPPAEHCILYIVFVPSRILPLMIIWDLLHPYIH